MEDKLIDQSQLAESVAEKIPYNLRDKFLVKPLDPIKVKKEFSKPVSDKAPEKDENGVEAVDYDKVETEVKEVNSDYRKGVVLKIPFSYAERMKDEKYPEMPIHVGDIVIYHEQSGRWFDLLKDTVLIDAYTVVGVEETKDAN